MEQRMIPNYNQKKETSNTIRSLESNDPWTCIQCSGDMIRTSLEWLACHRCDAKLVRIPRVENLPLATRCNSTETTGDRLFSIEGREGLWKPVPLKTYKSILEKRPGAGHVYAKMRHMNGSLRPKELRRVHKDLRELPFEEGPV